MELIRRFFRFPKQSLFLFGPRGTGKSTWLRAQLPDSLYLDLLEPSLHRRLLARPERLRQLRLRIDGIWCLPVEDFLTRIVPDKGLLDWL